MPEPTCRTCHRPIDTDREPIEAGRCQDCHNDHQKEFAEWLAGGWEE